MLFSCSKEQPLTPVSSTQQIEPDMIKVTSSSDENTTTGSSSTKNDGDVITDPEKEEKDKTNKKAKN